MTLWRPLEGDGVRVDAGVATGDSISPYYDPIVAKISAHGATRDEALRRLDAALQRTILFGVRSNLDYVRRVLLHPDHRAGRISTAFLEPHAADLLPTTPVSVDGLMPARLVALAITMQRLSATPAPASWQNNRSRPLLEHYKQPDGGNIAMHITPERAGQFSVSFGAESQTYGVGCSHVMGKTSCLRCRPYAADRGARGAARGVVDACRG